MKLFGGKARKENSSPNKETQRSVNVSTPYDNTPNYDVMGQSGGTKPQKQEPPPEKDGKGAIILLVFAIIAFLLAGAAFAAVQLIQPPELVVHENDKTIIDQENGDAVVIDPGQRISDYFTFLVCATDIDETRTDNMMVVGFDTKNHKVNVLNIPRDVMCSNNKVGSNRKINAAYGAHQDIENTKKEVKKVVGFTPDKYIVVNFNGIAQIVDAIGGIDYEVPFKMIYNDPYQDLHIYFEPGMQHMNGEQVVEFLRWRHNDPGYTHLQTEGYDGGDESRILKQQEFLMYLAKQILKPSNILRAKPIAEAVFNNVKTDLTMGELVWMANQAMQVQTEDIQMFTLPGYPANSYAGNDAYLSFYFPDESETIELVNTYFNPYDKPISSLDVIESPPEGKRRPNVSTEEDEPEYTRPPKEETEQPPEQPEVPEQPETPQQPEVPEQGTDSSQDNDESGEEQENGGQLPPPQDGNSGENTPPDTGENGGQETPAPPTEEEDNSGQTEGDNNEVVEPAPQPEPEPPTPTAPESPTTPVTPPPTEPSVPTTGGDPEA